MLLLARLERINLSLVLNTHCCREADIIGCYPCPHRLALDIISNFMYSSDFPKLTELMTCLSVRIATAHSTLALLLLATLRQFILGRSSPPKIGRFLPANVVTVQALSIMKIDKTICICCFSFEINGPPRGGSTLTFTYRFSNVLIAKLSGEWQERLVLRQHEAVLETDALLVEPRSYKLFTAFLTDGKAVETMHSPPTKFFT